MQCLLCSSDNPDYAHFCEICSSPLGDTPLEARHLLPPGSTLRDGQYTVGKVLGRGGFGITYLGSDVARRRPVAIKEFFPDGATRIGTTVCSPTYLTREEFERFIEQFLQEAELLSRFEHPSIVRVYNQFRENQSAYMVMDYHPAPNLSDLLENEVLEERRAIGYVAQIGEALHALHEQSYLHRDVKPSNILVYEDGRAVLIDFGTAREYTAGRTRRMTMMLTPGYAPLEQYTERARRGPFTDIYSLAGTLYHMLTGELPVAATDRAIGIELPPANELNPKVSLRVSNVVQTGLAMEVARRPQTAREFISHLQAALENTAVQVAAKTDETPTLRVDTPYTPAPDGYPLPETDANLRLTGHEALIHALAVSPSSRWVASGGWDATVRMWDTLTGRDVWIARLHTSNAWIWCLAFDPEGRFLAGACEDHRVRLWHAATGEQAMELDLRTRVTAVAFSPDGKRLACASADNTIRIFDASTGRQLVYLTDHTAAVTAIAFSPDGFLLASASEDCTVRLWEPSAGRQLYQLVPAQACARAVSFSPDGQFLAAAFDHSAAVWETFSARELQRFPHPHAVTSLAFAPDGRHLATTTDDRLVQVFRLGEADPAVTLEPHGGKVSAVAWSAGGELLVTGGEDRTVRLWRMRETLAPAPAPEPAPPPVSLVTPGPEVQRKGPPPSMPTRDRSTVSFKGHWAPARAVDFTVDGDNLITGSEDRTVRIWAVANGEEKQRLSAHAAVNCLGVSRSGGLMAAGSDDGMVYVWGVRDGRELITLKGPTGAVRAVAFSPSGQFVAGGGNDQAVQVWDVKAGGRLKYDLRVHDDNVTCLAFSPDEKLLVSGSEDRQVLVWNVESGQVVARITGHSAAVWAVAFTPDGRGIVSASSDRSVQMWDRTTQKNLRRYQGHKGPVRALAMPRDGRWLASGSDDRTIRFWDVGSGRELHRLDLRSGVSSLACSPNGAYLAYACFEPVARLVKVEKFLATAAASR